MVRKARLAETGAGLNPTRTRRIPLTWLDAALLGLIAILLALVAWRVQAVLNYRWNWAPIPNFLVRWDADRGWVANLLVQGLLNTIRLAVWGMLLAAAIGTAVALLRNATLLLPRLAGGAFVEVMRNTPPLVLIFVGYFFVSSQIMPLLGIDALVRDAGPATRDLLAALFGEPRVLKNFLSAVIVLGLFEGAYVAEILRAGIASVERGQHDAAAALGLRPWQAMRRVVLPQAVGRMVPPLCGQFISLVKDSSIVSLISVQDLTFMSNEVAVSTTRVFETWITASALYFTLCLGLSVLFRRWERRFRQ